MDVRTGPVRLDGQKNCGTVIKLAPKFIPNNITGKSSSTSNIVLPKVITAIKSKFSLNFPNYDIEVFAKVFDFSHICYLVSI